MNAPAPELDQDTATHLFNITKESITNAVRTAAFHMFPSICKMAAKAFRWLLPTTVAVCRMSNPKVAWVSS